MTEDQRVQRVAAPLRLQVVRLLRELILSGEFEPGQRLVEAPLCQRFEVSRTVVREAIRQLESEGLVTIIANRGPVVAELTLADAEALYEVRGALEALAGSLFARRADEAQCARLRAALDTVVVAYESGELPDMLTAKDAFYAALLDGARNPVIVSSLRVVHDRVQLLRGMSLKEQGRSEKSLQELRDITEAAAVRRDPEAARLACEQHVARAAEAALAALTAASA